MEEHILLINTGGTIVSDVYPDLYDPPDHVTTLKGDKNPLMPEVRKLPNSHLVDEFSWLKWAQDQLAQIKDMLRDAPTADLARYDEADGKLWGKKVENQFVKDSQEFDDYDIAALAQIIRDDSRRYFIITHGTSAMAKNAADLQELLKGSNKVVVFTGAMVPLSMQHIHESDAIPALEYTLLHIKEKDPGVYIVGRKALTKPHDHDFFDPAKVVKDGDRSLAWLQYIVKPKPNGR